MQVAAALIDLKPQGLISYFNQQAVTEHMPWRFFG
jgi:hypothetical protein